MEFQIQKWFKTHWIDLRLTNEIARFYLATQLIVRTGQFDRPVVDLGKGVTQASDKNDP